MDDPDGDGRWLAEITPVVARWCVRLGGHRIDAEAATSDVLFTLLRRQADRRTDVSLETWAYGITRRVVANHRRMAWFRRWVSGVPPEGIATHSPLEDVERLQKAARVEALLESMRTEHREVLVLCDIEERTSAEVAQFIGIPEGTVRSRLRAARARFRELAPSYDLDPPNDGGEP